MVVERLEQGDKPPKSGAGQTDPILRSLLRLLAKAVADRLAREQAGNSPQQKNSNPR